MFDEPSIVKPTKLSTDGESDGQQDIAAGGE